MIRRFPLTLLGLFAWSSVALADGQAVRFINDWFWEGPAAPLLLADDEGYFAEEGLDVTLEPGAGSLQAIPRVDSGEFEMGSADINSLIKYRDQNPDSTLRAVYVIYNIPPFAVLGRPSRGVIGPADLEGKTLGAPAADGAFAQWQSFVRANGIDASQVTIEDVGFPAREPALADGQVDAITGFSFSSYLNLQANGVPLGDISLMLMSDFGLDLYGNVIIVNSAFADANPEAVKGFLRAAIRGYQQTVANPAAAVAHVLARNEKADESTELRRLIMAIGHHIDTDEVREFGLGDCQFARLERSIEQLAQSYTFSNKPSAAEIFDPVFLPVAEQRMLPEIAPPPPAGSEPSPEGVPVSPGDDAASLVGGAG